MHDTERPRASARRGAIADLEAISRRVQPERESSRAVTPAFVVPKSCPEKPKTSLSYDRAVTRSFFALRKPGFLRPPWVPTAPLPRAWPGKRSQSEFLFFSHARASRRVPCVPCTLIES